MRVGDRVVCEAGDVIPGDGEVVEGIASVDESAITGESAPVIRESGGDRSAVTGGTQVISDSIVVRITAEQGKTFVDRMIGLVENATRQKTPGEIALLILLSAFSIIFLAAVGTLWFFSDYSVKQSGSRRLHHDGGALLPPRLPHPDDHRRAALRHRDQQREPSHQEERARPEREGGGCRRRHRRDDAGQDGHRHHGKPHGLRVLPGHAACRKAALAEAALLASLADETPEGRSIVNLARKTTR